MNREGKQNWSLWIPNSSQAQGTMKKKKEGRLERKKSGSRQRGKKGTNESKVSRRARREERLKQSSESGPRRNEKLQLPLERKKAHVSNREVLERRS